MPGTLPPAFAERRRKLFDRLGDRRPRFAVETLAWDDELREEVSAYCQAYRRALDQTADEATRGALLALDTVRLSIDTVGHDSIAAMIVLPLQPLRLAWAAEYDATLTSWAGELAALGRSTAKRRQSVDARLDRRVTPANLPFAMYGVDGSPFVYVREATLGTGVYLHPARPSQVPPFRRCSRCSASIAATSARPAALHRRGAHQAYRPSTPARTPCECSPTTPVPGSCSPAR